MNKLLGKLIYIRKAQALKFDCDYDSLEKRIEDLQFHNLTLLDDKKQLQETINQMKAAGAKVAEGGGLERELRELQDSLHQKVTPPDAV